MTITASRPQDGKMKKRCIISLCNSNGRYRQGMERLRQSLIGRFDGDFLGFDGEESIGAPPHMDNPYSFKIYAFEEALRRGYERILWVDSSVYAIKDVKPTFEHIENNSYIMQEAGHWVGTWTNDYTLNYFNITRDEAMKVPCYGNAGFLGLDFTTKLAKEFFYRWKQAMEDGCFNGSWTNENHTESMDERCKGHRHDLSVGSIIANQLGMMYVSGNDWLEYAPPESIPKNETIIWKAQGM